MQKDVSKVAIFLSRDIFLKRVRPQHGGFAVLLHYPNQFLTSFHTINRAWPHLGNKTNFWTSLNVQDVYVKSNRFKRGRQNCIEDWKMYDKVIVEERVKEVGCKIPDQITRHYMDAQVCNDKESMKRARLHLKSNLIPPCREIESIYYRIEESDMGSNTFSDFGKDLNNWFALDITLLKPRFQITIQKQDVDFQSLVGYIGGYFGLFMGFSLAYLPEIVHGILSFGSKHIFRFQKGKKYNT